MGYHVCIVGATGAVGVEFMQVLEARNFPVDKLLLLASKRSAGTSLTFCMRIRSKSPLCPCGTAST